MVLHLPPLSSHTEEIMGMCPADFQSIVNPWDDDTSFSTGAIDIDQFLMPTTTGDSNKIATTNESQGFQADDNDGEQEDNSDDLTNTAASDM